MIYRDLVVELHIIVEIHLYADDTKIYFNISEEIVIKVVQSCIAEIKIWIMIKKLQLNDGKTEFLLIAWPYCSWNYHYTTHITIRNDNVPSCGSSVWSTHQ